MLWLFFPKSGGRIRSFIIVFNKYKSPPSELFSFRLMTTTGREPLNQIPKHSVCTASLGDDRCGKRKREFERKQMKVP